MQRENSLAMEKEVAGGGYSWWKGDAKMEISWDLTFENNEEWGHFAMRVAVEVPHRTREVGVLDILMCGPCPALLTVTYMF